MASGRCGLSSPSERFEIPGPLMSILAGGDRGMTADATLVDARTGAVIITSPQEFVRLPAGGGLLGTAVQAVIDSASEQSVTDKVIATFGQALGDGCCARPARVCPGRAVPPLPSGRRLCLKRRGSAATPVPCRSVAQLVEHRSPKPGVAGSSPATPASPGPEIAIVGRSRPLCQTSRELWSHLPARARVHTSSACWPRFPDSWPPSLSPVTLRAAQNPFPGGNDPASRSDPGPLGRGAARNQGSTPCTVANAGEREPETGALASRKQCRTGALPDHGGPSPGGFRRGIRTRSSMAFTPRRRLLCTGYCRLPVS